MADNSGAKPPQRRGFGNRGDGPQRRGPRPGGRFDGKDDKEWTPLTKLGRLVKAGKILKLETIYLHSIPIKEPEIIDYFLKELKDEVMKVSPVQKQTRAGQRTRFKVFVAVGDMNGHLGLGVKVAKEVQGAIKGAQLVAKMSIVPVRRGYWGNKIGNPHTVAMTVTGKSGSCRVRLVPAPRGTGIVAPPATKKLIVFAGINDCYTSTAGNTKTMGNFIKATYDALAQSYKYLTPDFWKPTHYLPNPFEEHSEWLKETTYKPLTS